MIIFSICKIWQLALQQASVFARFPLPLISEIVRSIHVYLVVKPICYILKRNDCCIAWDSTLHYYMVVFRNMIPSCIFSYALFPVQIWFVEYIQRLRYKGKIEVRGQINTFIFLGISSSTYYFSENNSNLFLVFN